VLQGTRSDVRTVAALLGHADSGITLRVYGHVVAGAQERAVTSTGDALTQAKARGLAGQN
jgi:integrase